MNGNVSLIHLRKVFQSFEKKDQEVVAVEDFSLEIASGELVTLLGPSGCGKTTVLRMIAGFEDPSSGEIRIDDRVVNTLPPNQRNSAMVFQSYALFPHMNVLENISYGLKIRNIKGREREAKVSRVIETVGLKGYESRRPSDLSGGQQQRVALARALVIEPTLLLFDEPLSNLDAKLRLSMRNEIRRLQRQLKITAVYVTHDQEEAMAISDRVVVMNRARVEQVGTPEEVFLRPNSRFVADFMGATNFLKLTAQKIGSLLKIKIGTQVLEIPVPPSLLNDSRLDIEGYLAVRPQGVLVRPESGFGSLARVVERRFLGAENEYDLELDTGEKIKVRVATMLELDIWRVGENVRLQILKEAASFQAT